MPYIGKTPTVGNFQVCDAISVVNGQAAYTLQVGGVNVAPESANHMLVSLNGILQKPGSSFTISGSTMTFASNLATGDVIDFVQILGNVLDLGTPSDDTVTAAKLNNDIISGQTALTSSPDDTDELLISDAGTLKRIDYSLIKGGGIDMVDQYSLTSDHSGDSVITSNLARSSHSAFGRIGTGMSESSGIFTFPSTGIYLIIPKIVFRTDNNGDRTMTCYTEVTTDNSSYTNVDAIFSGDEDSGGLAVNSTCSSFCFIDVTDTSNVKVRFRTESIDANLEGAESTYNMTSFTFIRLGDT
tara:strand:+ start:1268 stop:2164 length:897 start_codon:yes stop_codon:yes gene_type:complete